MDGLNYKVSLLIPIYGVELFIGRCAHSLFSQSYSNIEYIFVDDCTKDNSISILLGILSEYPFRKDQVKIVHHTYNRGLAAARNSAFDNSTGDYILHVDSDDYLEADTVRLLLESAIEKKADVVICNNNCVFESKVFFHDQYFPSSKTDYIRFILERHIQPSIWGKLFSRKLYLSTGIRAIEGLDYGEDFAFVPRMLYYANNIVKLNKPLYNYVLENKNAYTKNLSLKAIDNLCCANTLLDNFFSSIPDKLLYTNSLLILKLRTIIYLLQNSPKQIWEHISMLYQQEYSYIHLLSMPDQLLLKLFRSKWYFILQIMLALRAKLLNLR